jgi:hypothetical protein
MTALFRHVAGTFRALAMGVLSVPYRASAALDFTQTPWQNAAAGAWPRRAHAPSIIG